MNGSIRKYSQVTILIPALNPGVALVSLAEVLSATAIPVVIVDDGSDGKSADIFQKAEGLQGVTVLKHAVNLGKGAALKTGINFILAHRPECAGIVTADADGQHHPEDILRIVQKLREEPDALVLGARTFGSATPLRSRFGNLVTRNVMRLLVGKSLADTQTGLRGIPVPLLLKSLKFGAPGYEFELEVLMAAKHLRTRVVEVPIRTIYEPGNPTSHFQPLHDSLRIYLVLLRFSLISFCSAALDNALFWLAFALTGSLISAQLAARIVSVLFNYAAVRKAAFHTEEPHELVLPRYLALAAANVAASWIVIRLITASLPVAVFPAKLIAETLLFLANFVLQRDFVFTRRAGKTLWQGLPAAATPSESAQ